MIVCHCASEVCRIHGCQRLRAAAPPITPPQRSWVCMRCNRSHAPWVATCPCWQEDGET